MRASTRSAIAGLGTALALALTTPPAGAQAPPPVAVRVEGSWAATATATRVRALSLTGLPPGAQVRMRCRGRGCPFRRRTLPTGGARRLSLGRRLRNVRLRPGAVLEIVVSAPGRAPTMVRFTMRRGRPPVRRRFTLPVRGGPPVLPAPAPPAPGPPAGSTGPAAPPPEGNPTASRGEQALGIAARYLGTPFAFGGASPATGFDDSGLVQYAYGQVGVALPRVASEQVAVGARVARADLRAGDLVFFQDSNGFVAHVGLATGDGRFLHAPHTGDVIRYESLATPFYAASFADARRVGD